MAKQAKPSQVKYYLANPFSEKRHPLCKRDQIKQRDPASWQLAEAAPQRAKTSYSSQVLHLPQNRNITKSPSFSPFSSSRISSWGFFFHPPPHLLKNGFPCSSCLPVWLATKPTFGSFTVVWLLPRRVIMPSMNSAKVRGSPSSLAASDAARRSSNPKGKWRKYWSESSWSLVIMYMMY